ncbi:MULTISPECIES: PepSY domain-containing protein [Paraclostridium]|uniref:PepSY domain-containing protein n=1 Tax=Paraclostridium TaxID=1849822 RepID=UPI001CC6BE9A|nr:MULTISPECIES: PepSY domain-containing protein [Paraclostridium]MBZ6005641.1 PepSY domain-containing protein [Paraclostridium bifermentans]MDU0297709.1 PepSY domain-containing protein [Paraclostridium sp. MRS3W1]
MKINKAIIIALGLVVICGVGVSYSLVKDDKAEYLTKDQAKNIILEKVPDGKILEFSYDNENNSPKYESEIVKDTMKYQVDVDAETGKIINFEQEVLKDQNNGKTSDKLISEDKAMDIMINKVPKATVQKFNLDKDGKNVEYEGVLTKADTKYEITVDAKTGDIKEFSHEQIKVKDTKADKDNQYGYIEIND